MKRTLIAGLLLSLTGACYAAKQPCADDVCARFYGLAVMEHMTMSAKSITIGEEAAQVEFATKDSSKGIAVRAEKMIAALNQAKATVTPLYQAAATSAKGNKAVTEALKALYTTWLTSVSYFVTTFDEQKAKNAQFTKDKKAIDDAWVKVQVEAGI